MLSPLAFIKVRLRACHRCQGDWLTIFTALISVSFKVGNSASNNCCLNWCWACSSICNTSEHHILWHLVWEKFLSVRIKMLGYLTWVALTFCLKQLTQCIFFSTSGFSLRGQITYTPLSLDTYNTGEEELSTVWTRELKKTTWYGTPCMRKSHIVWGKSYWISFPY